MKLKELIKDLKNKNGAELEKELAAQRERLWSLKNDLHGGKVKNVREIRLVKRMIARIMTFLKSSTNN